jgi:hypothetical protein
MSLSAGRQRQVDPILLLVSPAMAAGEDLAASSVRTPRTAVRKILPASWHDWVYSAVKLQMTNC